jgi:hypothetical protein
MPATSEQLWDAIYRIGTEDGTADKIQPTVIAKLIGFKMVERWSVESGYVFSLARSFRFLSAGFTISESPETAPVEWPDSLFEKCP